jgi:dynein heavy chain
MGTLKLLFLKCVFFLYLICFIKVRALDSYDKVFKIVAPKQARLAAAEAELAEQMKKLDAKRAELKVFVEKLSGLNDTFESEIIKILECFFPYTKE